MSGEYQMKMFIFMVVTIVLSVPQSGAAETISLEEFLTTVKNNHPFFEQESLSVDISVESQNSYLGDKDWIIESSPFISYENRTGLFNTTYDRLSQLQLNGSLQVSYSFFHKPIRVIPAAAFIDIFASAATKQGWGS